MSIEGDIKSTVKLQEKEKTVINLLYTYNWLKERSITFYKQHDLSSEQYNVLRILRGQHPNPSSISNIRSRMVEKMADVSRMIERMKTKELIKKDKMDGDKRNASISITSKGLDLLKNLDPIFSTMIAELNDLTNEESEQLNLLLDKFRTKSE